MENESGDKIGRVTFRQNCSGENVEDPVRVGAKISNLDAELYSI